MKYDEQPERRVKKNGDSGSRAIKITGRVTVWDLPTRAFHWSIVLLFALSWISAEQGLDKIHLWSGLAMLTLVIFRVIWGFLGSTTARFSSFIKSPAAAFGYIRSMLRSEKRPYAGHNPAGGWMVLFLIILLGLQAATGLFSNDDRLFRGPLSSLIDKPLSDAISEIHALLFNILSGLAALHIAAVLAYLVLKRDNLIRPMITGVKEQDQIPFGVKLNFVNNTAAAILLFLSAISVWWLIR